MNVPYITPWRLVLAVLLACAPAFCQNVAGVIRGQVVDETGAAVPAAEAVLTKLSTGTAVTGARISESGTFLFPNVSAGSYTLQVSARGFKKYTVRDIQLTASELRDLGRLTLAVGAVVESVDVQDTAAPLQLASGEKSGLVSGARLSRSARESGMGLLTLAYSLR